jgi:L-ascorbate metabolism protein UlaG (beta-lactamase superfamily)
MNNREVYLKPNVLVEPLCHQWYAWSCLISPATAAMYVANSHVKTMKSFLASPQVHAAALKNPAMVGGPFISYQPERARDIRALLDRTLDEQSHLIKLSEAIHELDAMLAVEAKGYSLEPLYAKVPERLRGYVELVYDLGNNPAARYIEGLLYHSPYYDESAQSVLFSFMNSDCRPFVLSTPRLVEPGELQLFVPFADEALDALFRMHYAAQPFGHIRERLGVRREDEELFRSFFTEDAPSPPPATHEGDDVKVRYFGHACVLIQSKEVSVLCDPVISYKYDCEPERFTFADLPERLDYVLITHNHKDHLMLEVLLHLRHKIENLIVPKSGGVSLADVSLKLMFQKLGFKNVREIEEMEDVEVPGGRITGIPFLGEHGDLNVRNKIAYLVKLRGKSVMCIADSNDIDPPLYERIHGVTGDVDVLFTGMECEGAPMSWMYGPLLTRPMMRLMDQSRRLNGSNSEKVARLIRQFNFRQVYIYAMGLEPWLGHVMALNYTDESKPIVESNRLLQHCREQHIPSERLIYKKDIYL